MERCCIFDGARCIFDGARWISMDFDKVGAVNYGIEHVYKSWMNYTEDDGRRKIPMYVVIITMNGGRIGGLTHTA